MIIINYRTSDSVGQQVNAQAGAASDACLWGMECGLSSSAAILTQKIKILFMLIGIVLAYSKTVIVFFMIARVIISWGVRSWPQCIGCLDIAMFPSGERANHSRSQTGGGGR